LPRRFILFLRRVFIPQVRYISLAADYFPLFLIMGYCPFRHFHALRCQSGYRCHQRTDHGTGDLQAYHTRRVGGLFFAHMFLVSILLAYFPFSKLMHLGGIFLSPTRNMTGNTRQVGT
jgi:nitrate reductase gamma subunit